ncbi:hypothetical protein BC567DRAFT_223665 [Phyllosticta citribraziliensis]
MHPSLSAPCTSAHWHSVTLFVLSCLLMSCLLQSFCGKASHSRTTASNQPRPHRGEPMAPRGRRRLSIASSIVPTMAAP